MEHIALDTPLYEALGPKSIFLKKLTRLGVTTVRDLLWHFPVRYEDFSKIYNIAELEPGQEATICGEIEEVNTKRTWRRGMSVTEAMIADATGSIRAIWFNQPYIANALHTGRTANFSGKVSFSREGELYFSNPVHEIIHAGIETKHTARLVPVYPETKGLTSRGLRFVIRSVMKHNPVFTEWLPETVLKSHHLPEIHTAIDDIHFPKKIDDVLTAQKRFSFEDLFMLQLFNLRQKLKLSARTAPTIPIDIERIKTILAGLSFTLTHSQKQSLWEIVQDMSLTRPMNRLLQGDVGSGKTIVATIAAISAAEHGFQTAFMAPTEILARQHFETMKKLCAKITSHEQPVIGLATGSDSIVFFENDIEAKIPKKDFAKKTARGDIAIIFGTHALIQKSMRFKNLGLVIIDEQHRFGVKQRQALLAQTHTDFTQTETDQLPDMNESHKLIYENLTYQIRGAIFAVKKELGLGHKEAIYQKAMEKEFKKRNLSCEKEKSIDIRYDQEKIGTYRPDFIVDGKILVELKALPSVGKFEKTQIWHYLKATNYRLALLINFGRNDVSIERIIHGYENENNEESSPLMSVSSPYQSVSMPHLLSMSATPIPRTLMLTIFGDLDLSLITELPAGRHPITTTIVPPQKRQATYDFTQREIKNGRQAFVICPRIETPDDPKPDLGHFRTLALQEIKTVKEEYEKLSKKIFPDLRIAMIHGQMPAKEKEKTMNEFRENKISILVATSVIEVGVDIPNASIMMIEGADRFGLAQLYQFRGRVGRGEHQSYCFLMEDAPNGTANARLKAIERAKNGFELAEEDMKLRGPGEFLGEAQSGFSDIMMRALKDPEIVKESREAVINVLQNDPHLSRAPILKEKLAEFEKTIHRE